MPNQRNLRIYRPAHSDFIIHWTGKDIDEKLENGSHWFDQSSSLTTERETEKYLRRLESDLRHGLWMNREKSEEKIVVNSREFIKPNIPRTCFSELKISEARLHAKKFGRLGIGVKRFFLFRRLGAPVFYYKRGQENLFFPPYSDFEVCDNNVIFCFFKEMSSPRERSGIPLVYDVFDESEWRIVYCGKLEKKISNKKVKAAFRGRGYINKVIKQEKKPEYLIPLDFWLSIIIYPSLAVQNATYTYNNGSIRELIKEKKNIAIIDDLHPTESKHPPIELDLDACRNF